MSQFVDNHPLSRDLPEFKGTIHELKMKDAHFSRLMSEYESVDKEVVRAEQSVDLRKDEEIDTLKMTRVQLKDTLYQILQQQNQ